MSESTTNLQKNPEPSKLAVKQANIYELLGQDIVKKRFETMLGKKAAGFISSIISATKANSDLAACEPNSVISAAVIAATLDLPIQSNLGFAAIIPYKQREGPPLAQFQMMWRGFVQLAMRTAQYKTINTSEVYEGELVYENRITGEYEFDTESRTGNKVIGYVAYFKMINGFEKYFFWNIDQVTEHAKKYSQSFRSSNKWVVDNSRWTLDFDAMAKKTVLKLLLSKYGILSVDMELAITSDQGIIKDADTIDIEYKDNPGTASGEEKKRKLRGRKPKKLPPAETQEAKPEHAEPKADETGQTSMPIDQESGNIQMP